MIRGKAGWKIAHGKRKSNKGNEKKGGDFLDIQTWDRGSQGLAVGEKILKKKRNIQKKKEGQERKISLLDAEAWKRENNLEEEREEEDLACTDPRGKKRGTFCEGERKPTEDERREENL